MTSADAETHIVHSADTDNPHADLASELRGGGSLQTTGSVRMAHTIVVSAVFVVSNPLNLIMSKFCWCIL